MILVLAKIFGLISMITVSLVTIFLLHENAGPDIRYCYIDPMPQPSNRIDDILLSSHKPQPGRSIYFIETRCHQKPWTEDKPPTTNVHMTDRQACSIESAALHNPNFEVFVLFADPAFLNNDTSIPQLNAILSYPNVHLRNINLWSYTANTPASEWFRSGALFKSSFLQEHVSDFLRILTLWRFGGTYFDTDVVSLRSIESLTPNFACAQDSLINNAVLNFAADESGHMITDALLLDFIRHYDSSGFASNGPYLISKVLNSICATNNVTEMNRKRCLNFEIHSPKAFYPLNYPSWHSFFDDTSPEDALRAVNGSYGVHLWNKMANGRRYKVGPNSLYGRLAREHCPKIYKLFGDNF